MATLAAMKKRSTATKSANVQLSPDVHSRFGMACKRLSLMSAARLHGSPPGNSTVTEALYNWFLRKNEPEMERFLLEEFAHLQAPPGAAPAAGAKEALTEVPPRSTITKDEITGAPKRRGR